MKLSPPMLIGVLCLLGMTSAQDIGRDNLRRTLEKICSQPNNGMNQWYLNNYGDGPYYCTSKGDQREWAMLRAYRSGGTEGTHWKYTNDANDGGCMTNWGYYSSDGQTLKTTVGRTTFEGDSRRWCALPVYRSGGVQGKQWQYCSCEYPPWHPGIPGRD